MNANLPLCIREDISSDIRPPREMQLAKWLNLPILFDTYPGNNKNQLRHGPFLQNKYQTLRKLLFKRYGKTCKLLGSSLSSTTSSIYSMFHSNLSK